MPNSIAKELKKEFEWLSSVVDARNGSHELSLSKLSKLSKAHDLKEIASFVIELGLDDHERVLLLLAMAGNYSPKAIKDLSESQLSLKLSSVGDFQYPTVESFLRLAAGEDEAFRIEAMQYLYPESELLEKGYIKIDSQDSDQNMCSSRILPSDSLLNRLGLSASKKHEFSSDFPAKKINTKLDWGDLILNDKTESMLGEMSTYLEHREELKKDFGFEKHIKQGYRALFYGPSGTGKSLTTALLGQKLGMDVYRVDLSSMVSKYVGETNKNLEKLFETAEGKNWILFFDEGDALLGNRKKSDSSTGNQGNQEIAYLLQRIEDFDGLIIVATNLKDNMDQAFMRRFESCIHFDVPSGSHREKVWKYYWPQGIQREESIDLEKIAEEYRLSVAAILNILKRISVQSIQQKMEKIPKDMLIKCINEEIYK